MSKVNPYEVTSDVTRLADGRNRHLDIILIAITVVFAIAAFVGVLEAFIPQVRAFTLPRFGGSLIGYAGPIFFLVNVIRSPIRRNFIIAGILTVTLGIINARSLWYLGTVPIIESGIMQRLHSSWLWAVLPFFLAGGYIFWSAAFSPSVLADPKVSEG